MPTHPLPRWTVLLGSCAAVLAVCGCSDDPAPGPQPQSSLLEPPAEGRGVQLRMSTTIDAGVEAEHCQLFHAPPEGLAIQRDEVRFSAGSHHVLVYLTPYQELPTVDDNGVDFDPASPVDCSDGPTDSFQVTSLIAGSQNADGDSMVDFPPGVAMRVPGNAVLLVNAHYVNASAEAIEPEVRVNLHSVPDEEVEIEGGLLFWYDLFVRVDAHGEGRATMSCPLPEAVRLGNAQSHMHARGVGYQAALLAPDGTRTAIYENESWSNVPVKTWADGLEIPAQSRIEFSCDYLNAGDEPVWQGPRSTDEMCMLIGSYWPANTATSLCASDATDPFDTNFLGADWVGAGDSGCAATLECLDTALQAPGDPLPGVTDCMLAARAESAPLTSDVARCILNGGNPDQCKPAIDACLAESAD
jgi:hypothetical protein